MKERNCLICKKSFNYYQYRENTAKYCSKECSYKREVSKATIKKMSISKMGKYTGKDSPKWKGGRAVAYARSKIKRLKQRVCFECNAFYSGGHKESIYWCSNCRKVNCICGNCEKHFIVPRNVFLDGRGKYCSISCANEKNEWGQKTGENHPHWKGGFNNVIAYRARKRGAVGVHTIEEWENLKKRFDYMCLCCKRYEPEIKLEEDHAVPLSRGGSNSISNIQPLCRSCNARKHDKIIDYISPFFEVKKHYV